MRLGGRGRSPCQPSLVGYPATENDDIRVKQIDYGGQRPAESIHVSIESRRRNPVALRGQPCDLLRGTLVSAGSRVIPSYRRS